MFYPFSFYVAAALLCGLILEQWRFRRAPWALPMVVTYVTVGAWYFADPILYPERYRAIPAGLLGNAYWEVCVFVVTFRLLAPKITTHFTRRARARLPDTRLSPYRLFVSGIGFWAILLVYGISRMDWSLADALLPLDGRNGNTLWLRAAAGDAGPTGFLVSTCGYLYLMTCASFGVLLIWQRLLAYKAAALVMIMISWPYFLLSGNRNQFLAVFMPLVFTYALFGRQHPLIRVLTLAAAFLCLNLAFKVVISHRNYGFRDLLLSSEQQDDQIQSLGETEHEGLNMAEELCFINIYCAGADNHLTLGMDYLGNLLNMVPRVLWPGKPLMGIEYAKWRGFGGGDSDIGVFATVSSGLIGQGVLEFGTVLGPVAPAVLMSLWCGLLGRWWMQRSSLLRLILFMLGLGVTFNLGRNVSVLILWPVFFAYMVVRLIEKTTARVPAPARTPRLVRPVRAAALPPARIERPVP